MARTDLYFKVVVEHEREEKLERLVAEIERLVRKSYIVKSVEFSHSINKSEE